MFRMPRQVAICVFSSRVRLVAPPDDGGIKMRSTLMTLSSETSDSQRQFVDPSAGVRFCGVPQPKGATLNDVVSVTFLAWNLGFYESGKLCKRLLPAEVTHLYGNNLRHPCLHDVDLRAAGHFR